MNSKHRKHFDFTYKTQKYPLEDLLPVILVVLKTGISWRDCEQLKIAKGISYSTFWNTHNRLIKYDIYKGNFRYISDKFYRKSKNIQSLSTQISDTTFIINKGGIDKIAFNGQIPKHKLTKISAICDKNGKFIDVKSVSGNIYDSKILHNQLEYVSKKKIPKGATFIADKAYDNNTLREKLKNIGYKNILIPKNAKNTKNPNKLDAIKKYNKNISKKTKDRSIIERSFAYLKSFKRVQLRYDKKSINFMGFVYLVCTLNILR